jgi:hypothetical protein
MASEGSEDGHGDELSSLGTTRFIRWGRDHGAGDGAVTTAAAVPLRLT